MDLNYMKRRTSLFDPVKQPGNSYPSFDFNRTPDEQEPDKLNTPQTPNSKFSSMYADIANQQSGPANQKFKDFLDSEEPNRDSFQPSKMTRLSAMLAGISDGAKHGGGAGFKTANDILDTDYNDANVRYNNQGKKLEAAAGLEERGNTNRIGLLKDITNQEHLDRVDAETARNNRETNSIGHERNKRMGNHFDTTINPLTGLKDIKVIGPDASVIGNISGGQGALTPDQNIDLAGKKAGAESKATKQDRMDVVKAGIDERGAQSRLTQNNKFENLQAFLQAKQDNGWGSKYVGHRNKEGKLVMINNTDPTDSYVTGTDFDTMSDADKQKAKIELKKSPGPVKPPTTKDTTVKRDANGKVIETKTTTGETGKEEDLNTKAPPPGGKPGGKWTKLPSGKLVYAEPS